MRTRSLLPAALLAALSGSLQAWPAQPVEPFVADCDSLDSVPLRQHMNYNADIQPIWSQRCANCHVDFGDDQPEADLSLNPEKSWYFLVNQGSSMAGSNLIRVVPDKPLASLLFNKVNCEVQDQGLRMPRARPPLPLEEQALIHDWILAGAPQEGDDTIFRTRFEIRG
ncbi:hypothetical protein [Tahibacter harae]|uniref:Cytochrome c domain-containing protein n=1 Tax=Tahibacter harae TaxID=2963937 RepID=A0ABT1QW30_9GAMM|nr:hypothetical protein [Tahibacter harae]MCQ4166492.1 hypothetical protein [Tahibacter harae]